MTCWHCGRAIALATGQKVQSRDACPHCDADLRVCRNCRHFEPTAHNECREVLAEWVRFKDKGNYCDYFTPSAAAAAPPGGAASARSAFDQLFKK